MVTVSRSRGAAVAVGILASLAGTGVQAASEVDVGGFHDRVIETTQRDLLDPISPSAPGSGTQLQVRTGSEPSALTGFTPRLGGLAIAGRRHSEASLLADEQDAQARRLQVGLGDTAKIAGWEIGLAATADVGPGGAMGEGAGSALMVGGELAVSRLRFDAAVGRDPTILGEDAQRMTAGVGYDFGRFDTRMSYSLVETEERAEQTGLLSLGSSLSLSSGMVLHGDLAIADEQDGAATTAGRVSLRLNF
jgi:hypothetical protein